LLDTYAKGPLVTDHRIDRWPDYTIRIERS
jgi:hypothetical protein